MIKKLRSGILVILILSYVVVCAAKGGAEHVKSLGVDKVLAARSVSVSEYAPTAGAATKLDDDEDEYYYIPTAGVETKFTRIDSLFNGK